MRSVVEGHEICLIVTLDGQIRYATHQAAILLERGQNAIVGGFVTDIFSDLPLRTGTPGYNLAFTEFVFADDTWRQFHLRDQNGNRRALEVSVTPLQIDTARVLMIQLRPIVDRQHISPDLVRLIEHENNTDEGIVITDTNGVIVYINATFEAMTGYAWNEAVGCTHEILGADFQETGFFADLRALLANGGEAHYLCVNRRKNGEWYFSEESIRPFVDGNGTVTHFVGRQRDVSRREREYERLMHLAHFDGLTGLPNRNLFLDRLHQEIARARRSHIGFTLCLIDLDGFKTVNDTHGHAAGDQLLQETAVRLKRCVRDSDTVARLGGDEFAIILAELTDLDDTMELLNKIKQCAARTIKLDGAELPIAFSIGVARFPEHAQDDGDLIKAADSAMYVAKRSGNPGWSFFGSGT